MKRSTFTTVFFIKRKKTLRNGEAPIYIRITINGVRAEASVKRGVKLVDWDPSKSRSNKRTRESINLNEYLD
jgi:hypothetical protein